MAKHTTGQRMQINQQAKNKREALRRELGLYKSSLTDYLRRQYRRHLEKLLPESDKILKNAESLGLASQQDVKNLAAKDAEVRKTLGKPARSAAASPAGGGAGQPRPAAAPTGAASAAANKPLSENELRKATQSAVTAGHRVWRSPVRQIVLNYIRVNRFGRTRFVTGEEAAAIRTFDGLVRALPQAGKKPAVAARKPTATRKPATTGRSWTGTSQPKLPATPVFPPAAQDVASLPQLQGAMDRLVQQRDQYINMVANGQMSAAQAESALADMLNSTEGSALLAQDQAAAQAWFDDAVNALYQTENNYQQQMQYQQQAYQQQVYQQQDEPDVEYVYEDGTPASPEDAAEDEEPEADDSTAAIQAEYEEQYEEDMGMGASYTPGERVQINSQANAVRLALVTNMGQYNRAITNAGRRIQRRDLEDLLQRSDNVLRRAETVGLRGADVEKLEAADTAARRMIGASSRRRATPPRPVAVPSRPVAPGQRPPNEARRWAAARAAAAAARQRAAMQDRALAAMPHLRSPAGQTTLQTLIQYRNDLQRQVAQGTTTAEDAKAELTAALTSGEGAAVAAQDQAGVAEWKKASDKALETTEQSAAVEAEAPAAAPATEPSKIKQALPVVLAGAIGAGVGYVAAEKEADQTAYAGAGGVIGLLVGLVACKLLKGRAEPAESPASAPVESPAAAVEGRY